MKKVLVEEGEVGFEGAEGGQAHEAGEGGQAHEAGEDGQAHEAGEGGCINGKTSAGDGERGRVRD